METVRVGREGQITLPLKVRQLLRLAAGDQVRFIELEPSQFLLMAVNGSVAELKGMFGKVQPVVSIDEMNNAISMYVANQRSSVRPPQLRTLTNDLPDDGQDSDAHIPD